MTAARDDTLSADDTRARILRVALELFAEQGFAATSTRELSERLGFTKAALYYHFRTKDDILTALVQPVMDELTTLITETPVRASAAARRAVLAAQVDLITEHLDLLRVLTLDPSVSRRPASAEYRPLQLRMLQLLTGKHDPGAADRTRARAALGAMRGALLHAEPDDDPVVLREVTLTATCAALGIPAPRRTA